ncbi:MAG: PEP-CTERM sorting domain-containing protein [Verrucomicrobiota bacterium]
MHALTQTWRRMALTLALVALGLLPLGAQTLVKELPGENANAVATSQDDTMLGILPVPEPTAVAALVGATLFFAFRRRRRQR